jgi:hypothetical protein
MISDGTLRPEEGAQLLAALAAEEKSKTTATSAARAEEKPAEKERAQNTAIQMQRPDGTYYTIEVPPQFVPMVMKMVGVAVRESARTAAQETWSGFKTMVRRKANEVSTNVRTRFAGGENSEKSVKSESKSLITQEQAQEQEARRKILQMVQNGRISAADASHLIEQIDALKAYQQRQPASASGK